MLELNKLYNMDCMDGLKILDDCSVDCCVTSPPYWGLRDYGVEEQLGLEDTPEEYVNNLVEVFREVKRVLKDDGTLWLNLGDSYSGSGKGGAAYPENAKKYKQGSNKGMLGAIKTIKSSNINYKPKNLIGIPWRVAFALQADGWYLRQDIIWAKTNPMPESVKDRCTKSHEYIFLLSKNAQYYFDAEAIAEPATESTIKRLSQDVESQEGSSRIPGKTNGNMKVVKPRYGGKKYTENPEAFYRTKPGNAYDYRPKRNKRDVWTVSTKPFKEAHFATFPPDLIEPCILAGCRVGGIVLDPFMGSGTVGLVAKRHNKKYIGFELNVKYIDIAAKRIENEKTQTSLFYGE
jgi:DNA modification methylase